MLSSTGLTDRDELLENESWLAVTLSWIVPGSGQVYLHRRCRGIILLTLSVFFYVASVLCLLSEKFPLSAYFILIVFNRILLRIFICGDAYRLASGHKDTDCVRIKGVDKNPWVAVFLSVLVTGLGYAYLRKWVLFICSVSFFILIRLLFTSQAYAVLGLLVFQVCVCIHTFCACESGGIQKGRKKKLYAFTALLLLAGLFGRVLCPLWVHSFLCETRIVQWGQSMAPAIHVGDKIIINKLVYRWSEPQVGDIIVAKIPEGLVIPGSVFKGPLICKRVVAVGGEAIKVFGKRVYVDGNERFFANLSKCQQHGEITQDPNETPPPFGSASVLGVYEPYFVRAGWYFLLGDNIENSLDSRYFGAFHKDAIVGKVVKIYWPLERMGNLR